MKTTDLMIGDWVFCDGKCYQIAEIGGMVCLDTENELFAALEDILPIPLTPEILEKNGFVAYDEQQDIYSFTSPWEVRGKIQEIYVAIKKKEFEVFVSFPGFKEEHWGRNNRVRLKRCGFYVHELQHALKLCGIEKEIKL